VLNSSDISIGSWIQFSQPAHAEILAKAGFDWLAIDLEHSVINLREAEDLIRIIELCNVVPLVRMSSNNPVQIARIMDAGAHGIIVPMINEKDEAKAAVDAVFYPPKGKRGVGLARAHGYGAKFEEYRSWLPDHGIVIVQIENKRGIENLRDILSVEGVFGFIVGPYDLSSSLGIPGQLDHPLMVDKLKEINEIADDFPHIKKGVHKVAIDPQPVLDAVEEGYELIAYSTDMLFMGDSCRRGINQIRSELGKAEK
jgi:2-keto-3-deoxy-L-rhamnonate aldolase RhmA